MHTNPSYDTVWSVEHWDPNDRYAMKSQSVPVNEPVIIEHSGTSHFLASDLIEYRNDFGTEYEVSVYSYATLNKSQSLALEKVGKLTRELPTKFQNDQNLWLFVTSSDPATDYETIEEPLPTPKELIDAIKNKLLGRGCYGIRGLSLVFKNMDKNGNHKLDEEEFANGMQNYGITLNNKVHIGKFILIGSQDNNGCM